MIKKLFIKNIFLVFCLVWVIGSFTRMANASRCSSISNGSDAVISSNCSKLDLNGGVGSVTINSGVTVSNGFGSSDAVNIIGPGISSSLANFGEIRSTVTGGYGINNFLNSTITVISNIGSINVSGNNGYGINNETSSTITTLNNSGTVSAGDNGIGIYSGGIIGTLNNSGTISTGAGGRGILNNSTITTLNNSGTISAGDNGFGIRNTGTISTLDNSGTISVADNGTGSAYSVNYGILNTGSITTLSNQGNITVVASGVGSSAVGIRAAFGGAVTSLINSGVIRATTTNTDGVAYGIRLWDGGTFSTITNTGSITATSSGANGIAFGIASFGELNTLNNAQGGNRSSPSTTALTYQSALPTNYNIIINSSSHYGQLAVSSPIGTITNFGIYGAPIITSRTYSSVLSGTALPSGTRSGTYDNMTWSLVENGSAIDLTFAGVSLMGTQQSLVNTAPVLQGAFTLQNSVMVNGFTYDCPVFDKHGICVSAGGRNTTVQAQGINNTSGLLITSYRLNKNNSRIGAWVDQNLSVSGPGAVKLSNSTPMIGLFGVWSQRPDGVGAEVKVSAAYGQKDTTVTRQIVGLSEAGSGSSQLISQGAQVVAKHGFAVMPDVVVSPYAGMRYTQNNMGGYTEATSSSVTAPLTYSALNTNATTALAGVGASYRGIPKTTLFASAGVETDTNTSNGSYSATGITGLTPVNFNPNPVKTRPTATIGGYYDILKNQRIGITGIYRQEAYQAVSTTTVLATYTIGF